MATLYCLNDIGCRYLWEFNQRVKEMIDSVERVWEAVGVAVERKMVKEDEILEVEGVEERLMAETISCLAI